MFQIKNKICRIDIKSGFRREVKRPQINKTV